MIRKELKKGICFSSKTSDKFKTSIFVINFCVPLTSKNAATYSLLTEVLKRGCNKYRNFKDISKRLVDLYSSFGCYIYKKGETLCVGVYNSFLDNKYIPEKVDILKENLEFISDFIFDPYIIDNKFNEEYIEQERVNLINRINEKINDKGSYAHKRCLEIMCENENYHISSTGDITDVKAVNDEDLIDAYNYLINSANVDMYYYGSSDYESIEKTLSFLVDRFPYRCDAKYPQTFVGDISREIRKVTEEIEATQGKLVIGLRTNTTLNDGDFPALVVFNEILGGSPISKLFINVREKQSLCYYCYSSLDSLKGLMIISSAIDINDYNKACDGILKEIERMKNGEISEKEFEAAKISLKNSYNEINDSSFSYINWYHTRHISGSLQTPELFSEMIQNVTLDEVIRVSEMLRLDLIYFLKGINDD